MQRVLIIAENSLQQERLCNALNLDRSIQLTTANLRQISPRNLRAFRQSDLIILEDTSEQGDPRTTEYLLSSLKTTGLPIILLPSLDHQSSSDQEPLVLNLTEQNVSQPGLAALINQIRSQYTTRVNHHEQNLLADTSPLLSPLMDSSSASSEASSAFMQHSSASLLDGEIIEFGFSQATPVATPTETMAPKAKSEGTGKVAFALTAVGRITKELREPLSNMNLAIHMLGQARSIEERDRYVKLLREEYQRELHLINELENLHTSILEKL
jgi:chemotaxis response regulator CheB